MDGLVSPSQSSAASDLSSHPNTAAGDAQPALRRSKRRSEGSLSSPGDVQPPRRKSSRRQERRANDNGAARGQQGGVTSTHASPVDAAGPSRSQAASSSSSPSKRTFDRVTSASSTSSSRGPIHWPTYALSKSRFSVTDLVGPSWCEYAFMYGVLGQTHLPLSQRPVQIVSEKGAVIQPDVKKAEKQEKTKREGQRIHEKLESEVHPHKVVVRASSREEGWARRFVGAIAGIRSLVDDGCVREMPVFGWVHGRLVTGIIDEIERRDIFVEPLGSSTSAASASASQGEASSQAPTASLRISSRPRHTPEKARSKHWTSQKEWKRDQARRKVSSKDSGAAQGAKDLRSFFGSTPSPKKKAASASQQAAAKEEKVKEPGSSSAALQAPAEIKAETTQASTASSSSSGWGFFLSDAKTRLSPTLPLEPAQKAARLQVMLYKRLVDGLVAGALLASSESTSSTFNKSSPGCTHAIQPLLDEDATPVYLPSLYAELNLDADVELGEQFMADVRPLLRSWGVALPPSSAGGGVKTSQGDEGTSKGEERGCTLSHLGDALTTALMDLVSSAKEGQAKLGLGADKREAREAHIIQPELTLVYRLQEQRGAFRRRSKRGRRFVTGKDGSKADVDALPSPSPSPAKSQGDHAPTTPRTGAEEHATSPLPGLTPFGTQASGASGTTTAGTTFGSVSSTPRSSVSRPSSTPSGPSNGHKSNNKAGVVIGRVAFPYSSPTLSSHVSDVFDMWSLSRELRGVTEDETWRCTFCAFREGCEWRELKGRQKVEEWWERRRRRGGDDAKARAEDEEEEAELWGLEMELDLGFEVVGEEAVAGNGAEEPALAYVPVPACQALDDAEVARPVTGQKLDVVTRRNEDEDEDEDEDAELWLHFGDDEELPMSEGLDW